MEQIDSQLLKPILKAAILFKIGSTAICAVELKQFTLKNLNH